MGGSNSRSTSQENEDNLLQMPPHVQQQQHTTTNLVITTNLNSNKITTTTTTTTSPFLDFGSNTTLDSDQISEHSLMSLNNDQRALLNHNKKSSGLGNCDEDIGNNKTLIFY